MQKQILYHHDFMPVDDLVSL